MTRCEQYEVWQQEGERWELVGAFREFELANAVARNRPARMRLIHSVYENGKPAKQDIIAEIGSTREVA